MEGNICYAIAITVIACVRYWRHYLCRNIVLAVERLSILFLSKYRKLNSVFFHLDFVS